MAGFALGALPSVTAVALGMASFRRLGANRNTQLAVGLTIMAVAALSVVGPAARFAVLCGLTKSLRRRHPSPCCQTPVMGAKAGARRDD